MDKNIIRNLVRGFYDVQKLRISTGNRIVANFYAKLGREPGQKKDEMDAEGKQILERLVKEAKLITTAIAETHSRPGMVIKKHEGIIDDEIEYELVVNYLNLLETEERYARILEKMVKRYPIWECFLSKVRGCGPLMSAVIISELDPYKAKYVSSFWMYAGLDVEGGMGRSRKKEHLVEVEYINKDGELAKRNSITFNPFLKTKLIGVLGTSFLRSQGQYSKIFYDYRDRLENSPKHQDKTPGHRKNMAIRYMIKMFLKDLWVAWRTLEGLPVTPDYAEAKLGLKHGVDQ
jgi:hypothetical protein